jgi:repressor LexA
MRHRGRQDAAALDHTPDPVSSHPPPRFTAKQGQYLAFIYTYTLLHREAPAEADFQTVATALAELEVDPTSLSLLSLTGERPRRRNLLHEGKQLPQNNGGQHGPRQTSQGPEKLWNVQSTSEEVAPSTGITPESAEL